MKKDRSGWKKITPEVIKLIKNIDMAMDISKNSVVSINKAIMSVTGIRTTATIKLIRDSNYDSVKYKELSRLRYPQAYAPRPRKKVVVMLDDIRRSWNNIISRLENSNAKIAHFLEDIEFSFYNGTYLTIELVNGDRFQQNTLEVDKHIVEDAIEDVLKKRIIVKFKCPHKPLIEGYDSNQVNLHNGIMPSIEVIGDVENSLYFHLNLNIDNSMDKIRILNNLINVYINFDNKENPTLLRDLEKNELKGE